MFKNRDTYEANTQKNIDNNVFSSIYLLDANNSSQHILKQPIHKIITGYNGTTYIILKNNTFMVYGYNAHGQLGLNHFDYVPEFIENKQFKVQNIFSSISSKHSFCITQENTLYAVGNNLNNQFGIQTNTANTLNKWTKINPFSFNIQIKSISTSFQYTLFLSNNGQIYQTNNKNIKLIQIKNNKNNNVKFKSIDSGKYHSMAISKNNILYAFGSNSCGQCGLNNSELTINTPQQVMYFIENNIQIKKVSCGLYHTLVLDFNGKVYCFGGNEHFQLGNGMKHSYLRVPQLNDTLKYEMIIDINCGGYHNLVINEKNEYFLWGNNKENQCLIYNENNENAYEYHERNNINFIKVPTKYTYDKNKMEVIDMYIGYKTTLVLSRKLYGFNEQNNESVKSSRKNKLITNLRKWYKSLKLSKKVFDLSRDELNDINSRVDDEKYEEDIETNSVREHGEYYAIPAKEKTNKKVKYYALSLNEC